MKLFFRILRAEGGGAVVRRILERIDERRQKQSYPILDPRLADASESRPANSPLINFVSSPPARRLGGGSIQLLDRLRIEARVRPVALLAAWRDRFRLQFESGSSRWACEFERGAVPSPIAEDPAFETAMMEAAARVGASTIHCEGLANVSLVSLANLARRGLRLILSVHDFALHCPRANLLEAGSESRFCGYCQDLARCHRCLRRSWPIEQEELRKHREVATAVLTFAEAVVYPSDFLRDQHRRLFAQAAPKRDLVIEPAVAGSVATACVRAVERPRHLAFVGAVTEPKGAKVFEEAVRALRQCSTSEIRFSVFGGGDSEILMRLRRIEGVAVHGYYRAGTLPEVLRRQRVDLALILSIVPEAFGLTLSECWSAGISVLAFDHGAVAERIRKHGGGVLAGPDPTPAAVVQTLGPILDGSRGVEGSAGAIELPTPESMAASFQRLYEEVGLFR